MTFLICFGCFLELDKNFNVL